MGSKHPRSSKQNHVFSQSRSWKCLSTRQIGKSQIAAVRFAGFDDEVPTLKPKVLRLISWFRHWMLLSARSLFTFPGHLIWRRTWSGSRYDVMKGEGVREVCGVRAFHAQDVEIVYASKQERKKQLRSNSQLDSTYQPLINTHYISLLITITPGKRFNDMCIAGADTWIYYMIYCMTHWCGPEDMCQHYLAWHCVLLDSLVRLLVGFPIAATWSFLIQPNNRSSNFSWSWTFLYYLTS